MTASISVTEGQMVRLAIEDNGVGIAPEHAARIVQRAVQQGRPFTMAFVDMRMPGWDGIETVSQLYRVQPELQVAICSASRARKACPAGRGLVYKRGPVPDIRVVDLCKSYRVGVKAPGVAGALRHLIRREHREIHAVSSVSFEVAPGEIVGFLGANGAGKTTTLKMLTGLIRPTSGQALVGGQVPFERKRKFLESITLVMGQKQQLLWDLPALDSLEVNAAVYDIPRAEARARVAHLARMLDVEEQLRQPVRKLSLGERMKCELLAALLHRPRILMLDEPTLGLDVNAQDAMRRFLREYNRERGSTVLLTSHYMADIVALCPRVLLIHEGRLIYDGSLFGLVERFAPYRQVRLELAEPVSREALAEFGEVEAIDGLRAVLIVERARLTETVARVLAQLRPRDLAISDPPVEQVVGKLFLEGTAVAGASLAPSPPPGEPG